jgi:predicted nucleic acid-binding protein
MRNERVVDASVIAAAFFLEEFTPEARRFLLETPRLIAPDHLHAEIASVAAKKVWRGETTVELGATACAALGGLVATTPSATLASRAFELAARYRFSAYDCLYLALAESREVPVYTFDSAFARKAKETGFKNLIEIPEALLGE